MALDCRKNHFLFSLFSIHLSKMWAYPAWQRILINSLLLQIDHDVCSNYGNWLYSAGIGNDPREDRKFNMVKQGLDYDPNVSDVL